MTRTTTALTAMVEIVLPVTHSEVMSLLGRMVAALTHDAERYQKVHKVPDDHPALQDKTVAAKRLRDLMTELEAANRKRWAAHAKASTKPDL